MTPRVFAVIIGRAGSRGLPGKNAHPLAGRPLVAWTIDAARAARCVDRVIVSTDCPAVAAAASGAGIEVIDRPAELASDDASVADAVRHAVIASGDRADIIVILYANVPLRPADLIDRAVQRLVESGADSVQSYAPVGKSHPLWMVRLGDDGRVEPYAPGAVHRRQELPPLLLPDGGVIAVRRGTLLEATGGPHAFFGADRRGVVNPSGSVIDIDEPIDLLVAEAMIGAAVNVPC